MAFFGRACPLALLLATASAFPVYDVTAGPALPINDASGTSFTALARLDSDRAVQCYANYGVGGAGTCNVLNVAGSEVEKLSTFVFSENETHEVAVAPFSNAVVVCYSDKGGTKLLKCKVLTLSGDELEDNGEPVTINAAAEEVPFVSLAALSDSVGVLCWSYVGYQGQDRAGVCNKLTLEDGALLVVGADYFFDGQTSTSDISVKAFSEASAVICWSAQGTGECSLLSLSDASGADFTQGDKQVFYTKTSEFFESVVVVSFTSTQGAVCYADGTDVNFVACKVLLVDGADLTVGSEAAEVNANPTSWVTAAAITDSAALVCYATEEGGNVNAEEFRGVGTCNVLGLTGDNATVGVGPPNEVNGNPTEHMSLAGLADFSAVLCYSDLGAGPGHCMKLSMAPTTTTVTTTSATSTTTVTTTETSTTTETTTPHTTTETSTSTETSTTSLHTTTVTETTATATAANEGPAEDSGSVPSGLPGLGAAVAVALGAAVAASA